MNIIDRYIFKKLFGTLFFILFLLSVIVVVIDVQQKSPRIEQLAKTVDKSYTLGYFLLNYYPFWMLYLIMTFMSILVFISIIFFTSKLANNTEIVAVISSGISFHRFAYPYFLSGLILAIFSLAFNHFILPWANVKKNKLEAYTYTQGAKDKLLGKTQIAVRISDNQYVFISIYDRADFSGSGFKYQKYDKNGKLEEQILANRMNWDEKKKKFILYDYLQRKNISPTKQELQNGVSREMDLGNVPQELFPDLLLGQNKTTPELISFIENERKKGNTSINAYLNELHQRTSMPVSIFILSILALSLTSEKRRGGIGINLAIGVGMAFVFVFSFEVLKVVAENNTIAPFWAMWIPNIIFGIITILLYWRRARQ